MQMPSETAVMTREELKRCIKIADRVLWETRHDRGRSYIRDYSWLQAERARLAHELEARGVDG
jgi:hypothetical protein